MAVQLRITADGVVVRFTGSDRVWACCRGVYLPLSRVLLARPMKRRASLFKVVIEPSPPAPLPRTGRGGRG